MTKKTRDLQIRLYFIGIAVLAAGLGCAVLIYLNADAGAYGAVSYVAVDGVSYPVTLGDNKMYVRELQRFGGKASVLFDEFGRWFAGLWHGKKLAFTVGWLSVCASAVVFLFARYLLPDPKSDIPE